MKNKDVSIISKLADKSAAILIWESHSQARYAITSTLRELGFAEIVPCNDFKSLQNNLRKECFDWIVTSANAHNHLDVTCFMDKLYGLQTVKKIVPVSVFFSAAISYLIPTFMAKGLLSWHPADYSLNSLRKEGKELVNAIEDHMSSDFQIAGHYLRRYFKDTYAWKDLVRLENVLMIKDSVNGRAALNLAEAYFLSRDFQQGRKALAKAIYLNSNIAMDAIYLKEKYLKAEVKDDVFAQKYNVQDTVVIGHDTCELTNIKVTLNQIGVEKIHDFKKGDDAWRYLRDQPPPSLVILEWNTPGLNGLQLIQRIRNLGLIDIPIIVVASKLSADEAQMMRDMAVSEVVFKPIRQKQLMMAVAWTIVQAQQPSEGKSIERKIIHYLESRDINAARVLKKRFDGMGQVSAGRKLYVEAYLHYTEKKYQLAVDTAAKALKAVEDNCIDIMVLLSRALMMLGDMVNALKFMEKVTQLSPLNISQQCELVNMKLSAGETKIDISNLDKAKEIDPLNQNVLATNAKHSLLLGDAKRASEIMQDLDSIETVISFLNNMAIGKIHKGDLQGSIEYYQKALLAIPKDKTDYRAIVTYNLALAFIRQGDLSAAAKEMNRALDCGESRIYEKALSVSEKLTSAHKKGGNLKLQPKLSSEYKIESIALQDLQLMFSMEEETTGSPLSGIEIGLRGIYHPQHEPICVPVKTG